MYLRGARRLRGGFNLPVLFAMLIDFYGNMKHARYCIISYFGRIVINLCLGVDVAKSEDEEFSVVDAVEFSPESLDFRVY